MHEQRFLLDIRDLSITLNTRRGTGRIVDRLSLTVRPGEAVGLVGESGSGKSMTALAVMRLLPRAAEISEGQILFEGEDLLAKEEAEMETVRGGRISLIFQSSKTALNPLMRIGDQIARAFEVRLGLPRRWAWDRAVEMLHTVGMPQPERRARSFPHQLSGGMAQRAMIALMLACRPQLLIADEPTTGLDVTTEAQIFDLIQELRRSLGNALLLITHDLGLVAANCERVAVMHAGHMVEFGRVRDVFRNPAHPYTQGLLSSIPRPDRPTLPQSTLVGRAPDPLSLPTEGCRFISRCPSRMTHCNQPVPWVEVEPEHLVFCHLFRDHSMAATASRRSLQPRTVQDMP